jgi:hypothetical protein
MDVALPDIIGEYVDTPKRFETGGIQYAGYFEPAKIAPEQVTHLFLFLQNAFNRPATVNIKIGVPQTGGLFRRGRPILRVQDSIIQLKLAAAEASLLTLPVTTGEQAEKGRHPLTLEFKVLAAGHSQRVRPTKSQSNLDKSLIDSPVGLNLVSTLGADFSVKQVKNASFELEVAGNPAPPERAPKLKYAYQTIWVQDNLEIFNRAIHEINLREVKLKSELTLEALYVTLYSESTARFADVGLPLRVGEAILLAKILTYSCQYFLANSTRRNGLLVPIWERALEAEIDTTDMLQIIRTVGYYHVLKLAIALSFGIIAKAIGQQIWPLVERQVVTNYIADSIADGQELDEDFLYLPLLMAGTQICDKLRLDGEDVRQSLALMKKAYEARTNLFSDQELARANKIYQNILNKSLQTA